MSRFDQIMLGVIREHRIPGAALAIAKEGRLVFVGGYGQAIVKKNVPFTPTTRSTLASVSKAVEGMACLKLVQEGRLNLDDRLYDVLGRPPLPRRVSDPRVFDITVRQLLHHSAGWLTDDAGYSPQVVNRLAGNGTVPADILVRYVLTLPLDYTPGTRCSYSNFQWNVVRRVIESVAREPDEVYVRQHVLEPAGIYDMQLEGPHGTYLTNEAHRYNSQTMKPVPGGHGHMKITGSLGSWLASVVDMVKFLTAVDGTRVKDFLAPRLLDEMVAAPAPPAQLRKNGKHFGLGWDVAYKTDEGYFFAKNGGVAGAKAYIEHLPNNVCFAFLLNGSGTKEEDEPPAMGEAIHKIEMAIRDTQNWPAVDLFTRF